MNMQLASVMGVIAEAGKEQKSMFQKKMPWANKRGLFFFFYVYPFLLLKKNQREKKRDFVVKKRVA